MCTRFRRRNRLHACLPGDFNEIEEDATDTPKRSQPNRFSTVFLRFYTRYRYRTSRILLSFPILSPFFFYYRAIFS